MGMSPKSINEDESLWTGLAFHGHGADFIRQYRMTACPVEGDDDVDDDLEDVPETPDDQPEAPEDEPEAPDDDSDAPDDEPDH